jgi:hypothetical protein
VVLGGMELEEASDLRVGGSNPSGRAITARVCGHGAVSGKRLVAIWSPADSGMRRNRSGMWLRGVLVVRAYAESIDKRALSALATPGGVRDAHHPHPCELSLVASE